MKGTKIIWVKGDQKVVPYVGACEYDALYWRVIEVGRLGRP